MKKQPKDDNPWWCLWAEWYDAKFGEYHRVKKQALLSPDAVWLYLKLAATRSEFGEDALDGAVILSDTEVDTLGLYKHVYSPTIATPTLGNVQFKVARFFEDFDGQKLRARVLPE